MPFTVETALKLALVPAAVWVASLAARRWGHAVSGYLGGMPMIGGPITLYLALDQGATFAAHSATMTLAAIAAQGAYGLAFAAAGRRHGWVAGLSAGWLACGVVSLVVAAYAFAPWEAALVAIASLLLAGTFLPRAGVTMGHPAVPRVELALRLVASLALAAFILWGAARFGPVVSGILLSWPVTGSILPPFTLKLYGPDALARLLRGFVTGLWGFGCFFLVVAIALEPLGLAAFGWALAAALVGVGMASWINNRNESAQAMRKA